MMHTLLRATSARITAAAATVEIDMTGTPYVFDPNFEYGGYGNGYQINYGMSGTFKYIDYARVD